MGAGEMSAQAKTAPTASFSALSRCDWKGVIDLDPQCEPLVPTKEPEKTWRDFSWDARHSITNAERSGSLFMRRANLMCAQNELRMALEALR